MQKINQKVETLVTSISQLNTKIQTLENFTKYLEAKLTEETDKRMSISKGNDLNFLNNETEINKLKTNSQQMQEEFSKSLSEIKNSLTKDYNNKINMVSHSLEQKSKLIDTYDKFTFENEFAHKKYEDDVLKKLFDIETEVSSSLKLFREEINTNSSKIDFFEKKIADDHDYFAEQLSNFSKQIIKIENDNNMFKTFKSSVNDNFKGVAADIMKQQEIIENFKNKIITEISNFEKKINSMNLTMQNDNVFWDNIKSNIYKDLDIIDEKNKYKIKELTGRLNMQMKTQQNEMHNFQNNLLGKQSNFNDFIHEKMNNFQKNVNKNLTYSGDQMKKMKNNINDLVESQDNLRINTALSLNDLNSNQTRNYESLQKMIRDKNTKPIVYSCERHCHHHHNNGY